MATSRKRRADESRTVPIRGRPTAYLDCRRIVGHTYYLLHRVGSPFRQRFKAFDPQAGPGGDHFLVQLLPGGPATEQYLRSLRALKADSLPRVVAWQRRAGQVEVVLTWVDGIPLSEYLKHIQAGRRPPVDPREAVRLVRGLANAVCQLHAKHQLAHGDIQPANVVLADHRSRLILIDFGSAWPLERTASRQEGDGVHRCYAAPELQPGYQGTPLGLLADQFSVSVILYQLLTCQLPYGGLGGKAGRPEYAERARDALRPPSQVSQACRDLPRSLREGVDRLAMRGLALDPAQRYPDRHTWLDDFSQVHARFCLPAELGPVEKTLTQVVRWLVKPSGAQ